MYLHTHSLFSFHFSLTKLICSVFDKQEGILYLLLEYGEMDLNALLKARDIFQGSYHMNTTFYIWIQMLRAVKVSTLCVNVISTDLHVDLKSILSLPPSPPGFTYCISLGCTCIHLHVRHSYHFYDYAF